MKSALIVCGLILITAQVRRAPPVFHPLGDSGAQEAAYHVEPLPILGGQLEIRLIGIGQDTELVLPTDNEVALEVRTGNVIVTTNGERQEHTPGDIWVVPTNARVTIVATGEGSALRAMYLVRNQVGRALTPQEPFEFAARETSRSRRPDRQRRTESELPAPAPLQRVR